MALAVYARTQSSSLAASEAFATYHRLLSLTQLEVVRPSPDAHCIDACLLTIFLMGRCESVMHQLNEALSSESFGDIKSWSHHDGAMALLRFWHLHFREAADSSIAKQTRRGILKSLLLRAKPVPKWLQGGRDFGEQTLELKYDGIFARLVNLRSAVTMHPELIGTGFENELLSEARQIGQDLQDFEFSLASTWVCSECEVTRPDHENDPHSRVRLCTVSSHVAILTHVLATTLLVNHVHSTILQHRTIIDEESGSCQSGLHGAADNLTAMTAHYLKSLNVDNEMDHVQAQGRFRPYQVNPVIWPLTIAASVGSLDTDRLQWFKSTLVRLGKIVADGVLQRADSEEWLLM